jgi:hypothetical protein
MNTPTARIYQQLSDIAENAQTAPTGDGEALHNILIDLISATRALAAVEVEAVQDQPAPAAQLNFWEQIEAIKNFAEQEAEADGSGVVDLWAEFSTDIDLHIFNENGATECHAYPIRNGQTDVSRLIKIF